MNGDSYSEYKNIDYTGSAVRREEKPIKADAKDKALAAVCFALGYIIVYALTSFHLRAVFAVFSVLYSASVLIYIYAKGSKPAGESWFWLAAYLFAALPFPFWSAAQVLQFFMFFIFGAYFTLSAADALIAGKTSSWIFKDACKSLITVPFCNLGCIFTVLNSKSKKGKGSFGKTLLYILLGLCIALPMLMIVLPLLLKADSNMQAWFSQLFRYLHFNFASFVIRASLAVFAAMIIFGLIYGSVNGRHTDHTDKKAGEKAADRRHVVPDVAMYTAVTVVCALYILFIGLQSSYFISAFANTPPASFTYSEYARQGFFDLCAVAAVNMCIMLFANLFSKTKTDSNKACGR